MPTSLLRASALSADFVSGVDRPTFAVRNGHRVAVFPDIGTTRTYFLMNMPTVFAQGDIEVKLTWIAAIASGSDCVWEVAFERHQVNVDDLDGDSFGTTITFVQTAPGSPGIVQEAVIPVTAAQYDGITQGDQFRLRVSRIGDDTSDTMSGDAQLISVVIEQEADPVGGGGGGFFTDGAGTRAGIGKGSPAPTAAGLEGLSHGSSAAATGDNTLALGPSAVAASLNSLAFGPNSRAGDTSPLETDCLALGTYAEARGPRSIAIGYQARTRAYSNYSIAIGYQVRQRNTTDPRWLGIGSNIDAQGEQSVFLGHNLDFDHSNGGILIGRDLEARGGFAMLIGKNNQAYNGGDSNTVIIGNDNYHSSSGGYRAWLAGHQNEWNSGAGTNAVMITRRAGLNGGNAINSNGVVIGGDSWQAGINSLGGHYDSVILRGGNGQRTGSYMRTGAFVSDCIAIGVNDGALHSGSGASQQGGSNTIFLGADAYLYGYFGQTVCLTARSYIGVNGASSNIYQSVFIGYGINDCDITMPNGGVYGAVSIGSGVYSSRYEYSYGHVAIGMESWIGETGGYISKGQIALGHSSWVYGPGQGNIAAGYHNSINCFDQTQNYYFQGNVALGAWCYIVNASGYISSTMAQGLNSRAVISGQRAWAAGGNEDYGGNSSPNQFSFIVEKHETTDATQTTTLSFPIVADKAYIVWGKAVARRTDVDGENRTFEVSIQHVYRNAALGPVLISDPVAWTQGPNQGAPAWSMDMSINSNNLDVRVTGEAAKTIEWLVILFIGEVRG